MILVIVLIFLIIIFLCVYGVVSVSHSFYLKSLCRNHNVTDKIALTFDDGVDADITPRVLDVLERHKAKATFFIIGEKAKLYPEIVAEIVKRGHSIGNHSYFHRGTFPLQTSKSIKDELVKCTEVLEKITKQKITLFRPPFGVTNPMIGKAVSGLKLTSIGWSIRSFDTMGHPLEKVAERVIKQIVAGKVILLHDNRTGADILVDKILIYAKKQRLHSVTVDELFNLE